MFRIGVIILFSCLFVSSLNFLPAGKQDASKERSSETSWIEEKIRSKTPRWVLPQTELLIVKSCSGILDEDFGYLEPTFKMLYFFKGEGSDLRIHSSKLKDSSSFVPRIELSSMHASDLNLEIAENIGVRAEHGSLGDLVALDQTSHSRRLDRLVDEAVELCTADYLDPGQRDLEAERVRDKILSEASVFVSFDYMPRSTEAELEILYELDGLLLRSRLQPAAHSALL